MEEKSSLLLDVKRKITEEKQKRADLLPFINSAPQMKEDMQKESNEEAVLDQYK